MKEIVITGATGFLGSNLVRRLLQDGESITILLRKEYDDWRIKDILPKLNVCIVNFSNKQLLKKKLVEINPEIVFHLATFGSYPHQTDLHETVYTNIINSINLMEAVNQCKNLSCYVNLGSSSEYGLKQKPMNENDIAEPITAYGITKVTQTLFTRYFSMVHKLPSVTLRLFSVYGPYENLGRLITEIMLALIHNYHLKLSSPYFTRDFIYIDDVLDAICVILKKKKINNMGKIFNIGSGTETSIKEVVKTACEVSNSTLNHSWGNPEKKRSFDYETKWVADLENTIKCLKWKPRHSLKEGLLKTYLWYKENFYLYKNFMSKHAKSYENSSKKN